MRLVSEARGLPFFLDRIIDRDSVAAGAQAEDGTVSAELRKFSHRWQAKLRAHAAGVLRMSNDATLLPLATSSLGDFAGETASAHADAGAAASPRIDHADVELCLPVPDASLDAVPALSTSDELSGGERQGTYLLHDVTRRALAEVLAAREDASVRGHDPSTAALYVKLCERADGHVVDGRQLAVGNEDRLAALRQKMMRAVTSRPREDGLDPAASTETFSAKERSEDWSRLQQALQKLERPDASTPNCCLRAWILRRFVGALIVSQVGGGGVVVVATH